MWKSILRSVGIAATVSVLLLPAASPRARRRAAQAGAAHTSNHSISGRVGDETGGVISGASVTIVSASGASRSANTDSRGNFQFQGLQPGKFSIKVSAGNFAPYEDRNLVLSSGANRYITVTLQLALRKDQITVLSANPLFNGAAYSGGSFIISGDALESLPEGPGGLDAMLRALAVRTSGPFGPQVLVNGFEDNPVPLTNS